MVRGDELDVAPVNLLPEGFEVLLRAQRRRALGDLPESLRVFFGKYQIVGAGLAGYVHPPLAGRRHEGNAPSGAHVDDVQRAAGLPGEQYGAFYGLKLRDDRTRVQVIAHRGAQRPHPAAGKLVRDPLVLRVNEHRETQLGGLRHPFVEREVVGGLEVYRTGGRHERFEPRDASLGEFLQVLQVAGNESAVEREVHHRRGPCEDGFLVEAQGVIGRRVGVQRHLHKGRHASRRQGAGACGEPLPVGAAGFVEVGVGVYGAG